MVEAALDRGHDVTVFTRGRTGSDLYPEVERLRGDRDSGDLSALAGRSWDAVVDTSARLPRWVRDTTRQLAFPVEHYTFVSSCSVYADTSTPGTDESSPVLRLEDETTEAIASAEVYGGLKALCEREAEQALPGRVLPLWLAPGSNPDSANFLAVDASKAVAAGLRFRPLAQTIRDTLARAEPTPAAGLDPARERELLAL
jgi:nucleoside-diphosphate-sugar epimerase